MKKYLVLLVLSSSCIRIDYPAEVIKVTQTTGEKNRVSIKSYSAFEIYFLTDSVYHVGDILR